VVMANLLLIPRAVFRAATITRGEVFRPLPPLRLANQQLTELLDRIANHTWKRGDPWHRRTHPDCHGHLNQCPLHPKFPIFVRPW